MNTATNNAIPTDTLVTLPTPAVLTARANAAVATIHKACVTVRDAEWPAYQAAQLGCAHLGHVETLEAIVRRAERMLASAPRG